jgi:hypothetical protein
MNLPGLTFQTCILRYKFYNLLSMKYDFAIIGLNEKVNVLYDPKKRIFYKYYIGSIEIEDLTSSWEELIHKDSIPINTKKYLLNYSQATLQFHPKNFKELVEFFLKNESFFSHSKIAMIVNTPAQTVFPQLLNLENISFHVQAFCLVELAEKWLSY